MQPYVAAEGNTFPLRLKKSEAISRGLHTTRFLYLLLNRAASRDWSIVLTGVNVTVFGVPDRNMHASQIFVWDNNSLVIISATNRNS